MSGLIGLSLKKNGLINHFTSLGIDDNATSNAVTIDASENVTITDGALDFDVASHDGTNGLKLGGTLVSASATELNIIDGVTATTTELNTVADGNTSIGTTAVAGSDGFVTNDSTTMRQTTVDTLDTYLAATTKTMTNKTLVAPALGTPDSGNMTNCTNMGGGKVIQTKFVIKRDTATTTNDESAGSVTTGMAIVLDSDLASSSNKVLIMVSLGSVGQEYGTSATFFYLSGNTTVAFGDAGGSCQRTMMTVNVRAGDAYTSRPLTMIFEDTPGTATKQTYTLYWNGSGGTNYLNRPYTQDANGGNTISTMTAMEISV